MRNIVYTHILSFDIVLNNFFLGPYSTQTNKPSFRSLAHNWMYAYLKILSMIEKQVLQNANKTIWTKKNH